MFATSPVGSIWLEMSINWPTTSQGPKKKSIQITKRKIDPCPSHTARNKGSFTTMVLWIVQRFSSLTVSMEVFWDLAFFLLFREDNLQQVPRYSSFIVAFFAHFVFSKGRYTVIDPFDTSYLWNT